MAAAAAAAAAPAAPAAAGHADSIDLITGLKQYAIGCLCVWKRTTESELGDDAVFLRKHSSFEDMASTDSRRRSNGLSSLFRLLKAWECEEALINLLMDGVRAILELEARPGHAGLFIELNFRVECLHEAFRARLYHLLQKHGAYRLPEHDTPFHVQYLDEKPTDPEEQAFLNASEKISRRAAEEGPVESPVFYAQEECRPEETPAEGKCLLTLKAIMFDPYGADLYHQSADPTTTTNPLANRLLTDIDSVVTNMRQHLGAVVTMLPNGAIERHEFNWVDLPCRRILVTDYIMGVNEHSPEATSHHSSETAVSIKFPTSTCGSKRTLDEVGRNSVVPLTGGAKRIATKKGRG